MIVFINIKGSDRTLQAVLGTLIVLRDWIYNFQFVSSPSFADQGDLFNSFFWLGEKWGFCYWIGDPSIQRFLLDFLPVFVCSCWVCFIRLMNSLQFPRSTMAERKNGMIALFDVDGTLTAPRKVYFLLRRIKLDC